VRLKGKGLQEQVSQPENAAGRNNCNRAKNKNCNAMKKIGIFLKSRLTIDVAVFIVFFLVTVLFVLTIVSSF